MTDHMDNSERSGGNLFFKLKSKRNTITILLCLFSFFIGWFFFHGSNKKQQVIVAHKQDGFVYKTAVVQYLTVEDEIEAMGTVTYNENNVVRVYPIVSGKVEDVQVSLGSYVKRGQDLAKIRSADVSDFIKQYNIAKTNFELARKNLAITDSLYKSKFSSKLDLIKARNEFKKANDEFLKNKEILNLYHINPYEIKPIFSVKSTVDGYIVEKNITNSMLIRPDNGTNLFTISDLSTVWVYSNVFENNLSKITVGQKVSILPIAYNTELTGKVDNISAILDKSSKVLKVRTVLQNTNTFLKPDMAVKVVIHVPKDNKVLAVPPKSLIFDKDTYYVLKCKNKKVTIQKIKLAFKTSQYSYIESGVSAGDTVVAEGSLLLYNQIANNL